MKVIRADRLPQVSGYLDAELRANSPALQQHMQALHVGLREWRREYEQLLGQFSSLPDRVDLSQRNLVINGGFQIWQRGTSFAAAAARVLTADRWSFWRASAAVGATASRQTGDSPSQYCARVQRDSGNASTAAINFAQAFKTENTYQLQGQRLGVRFKARAGANYSSASSALTVQFLTGTGTDQHPSLPYTGAATQASSSVTLTTAFKDFTVDLGTVGATVTETALNFTFTPVGTASTNDYFDLQEVLLVAITDWPTSNVVIDMGEFPWKSFQDDLAECLPYFEKSFPYATAPAQNTGSATGAYRLTAIQAGAVTHRGPFLQWMARKIPVPTMTTYNPSAANAEMRNTTSSLDCSGTSSSLVAENGILFTATGNAGGAVGDSHSVHWTAESEL